MRFVDRGRKTWRECVKDDMDELGLHPVWTVFKNMWRSSEASYLEKRLTLAGRGKN